MITIIIQILLENVNFLNYRTSRTLGNSCELSEDKSLLYPHTYPPRFIIEVTPTNAQKGSTFDIELNFNGPTTPITITIQLHKATTDYGKLLHYYNIIMGIMTSPFTVNLGSHQ